MKLIPWTIDRAEEVVNLWNREMGKNFPMRLELFIQNSFMDENICREASRIAITDAGSVIGFIAAKKWQEHLDVNMRNDVGWIQALLVDKDYRNQGVGTQLLAHAESEFIQSGLSEILLGKDPWHYFPGVPSEYEPARRWFDHKGYTDFGTEYDLICHYGNQRVEGLPLVEDAKFEQLKVEDSEKFLAFLHRCFPGRWEYEAMHYFKKGGTGREFIVLKKNGKIIGFSRINDSTSPLIAQNTYWSPLITGELGGIGPLGIDEAERGNGYGLAIVEAAIATLRKRDIHTIIIDWTTLVGFYSKIGYTVWKSYQSYKKEI